jgi:hypothetical protein
MLYTESEKIAALRRTLQIPDCYGPGWAMPSGEINWDHCDSTIAHHPDGSTTETHMGLHIDRGHEFVTRPWTP